MQIRPKTVRRLLILTLVVALVGGAAASWLMMSMRRQRAQVAALRQEAHFAYQASDYARAVALYNEYFTRSQRQSSDAEAVYEYARSRAGAPTEGGRHVYDAIHYFEQYLQLEPDDPHDARHPLLQLYAQAHYNKEARSLADKLLAKNPTDADAMRAQITAMVNDRDYASALPACQRLNGIDPLDLIQQRRELELMAALKKPADQILAHARALLAAHPDDARFHAVMSVAYALTNADADSRRELDAASKLPPPADADAVLQIVSLLDQQQQFGSSDDLLTRATATNKDPRLLRLVLERLWERQSYPELINRLKTMPLDAPATDPSFLGYEALALFQMNRAAEAAPLVDALGKRKDDPARAWAIALRARFASPSPGPAALIAAYRDAVLHDPSTPIFSYLLGEAYAAAGDTDKAVVQWQRAGQLSPSWALPYWLISKVLSASARYPEALRAAQIATRRAPHSVPAECAYAIAWFGLDILADPKPVDSPNVKKLVALVEQIQGISRNEPTTLPIYVSLLARQGHRDKAMAAINGALAANPALGVDTLVRLAAVSDQEHLGLESTILDQADQAHGESPAAAFERATILLRSGKPQDGLALLDRMAAEPAHRSDPGWQLAVAQFRDALGDPAAIKRWIELGDANPDDLRVQTAFLASPARFADRPFWRRTIDRVKSITGAEGQLWQIEQARWQLGGDPTSGEVQGIIASLQQIVREAPNLPDPHALLGQALLRTAGADAANKAVAELAAAHDLKPGDFEMTALLAQVLAGQGARDKAMSLVDAVARDPHLSPRRRQWTASMYDSLGAPDAAIKMLMADGAPLADDASRTAMLAGLYRRAGHLEQAAALYKTLLDAPKPDRDALIGAANFFAASGKPELSGRFLDRLQAMQLAPGTLEVLRAHVQEIGGKPREALATLQAGVAAHPASEELWQELAAFYLRQRQFDEADKAATKGLAAVRSSSALAAIRTQVGRLRTLAPQEAGNLAEVISHDPQQPIADRALALLSDAKARGDSSRQVLAALRELADQNIAYLPLQELLVQRYTAAGRFNEATEVASRMISAAPNDPEPLRLLCAVQSAAGNWTAARQAAERWRQLIADHPLAADLTIATTYLQQPNPDPSAALNRLASYESPGVPESKRQAALPVYCHALVMAGRADDAAALLKPLLEKSPRWRAVWLQLAAAGQKDVEAASAWLHNVSAIIPADSVPEQLGLADAWEQVGTRYDSAAAHEAARGLLQPIVAGPAPVPPQAWAQWGAVSQSLGSLPEAERAWREFLKLQPGQPLALNNLAYMLLLEGDPAKLAEAERFARDAIAADPAASTFYDTLARVQLRAGKPAEAVKHFRAALDCNPNNVEAMIGLADILQSRPAGRDEAKSLLTRINGAVQDGSTLPIPIRRQWERVKSALSSSL